MAIFRSLRLRFVLAMILVALIPVGTVAVLVDRATENAFHNYAAEQDKANAQSVAAQLSEVTGQTISVVGSGGTLLANEPPVAYGTGSGGSVSIDGMPATDNAVTEAKTASVQELPETAGLVETGTIDSISTKPGTAGVTFGTGSSTNAEPVPDAFTLSWPGVPDKSFLNEVNRALMLAVAIAAGGALLLAILLARSIVRPVEQLTSAARGMAEGDLGHRVQVRSTHEIGVLAQAFNSMAESRLRLEGLRRNLVNDVAHELRTPLANLQGYLEVLRDGLTAPTPEILAVLHEESLLLNGLVADLQELALAEAGQLPLMRETVDVREPILNAVDAIRPQAEGCGLTIASILPDDLPEVLVDTSRFGQILRNLLRNAVTHTPPGGRIDINAAAVKDGVSIAVRDTGHGIEPEHLPYIFDRFYRADPARARDTGGSGLGLAVVKNLVEAHGGRIEVSSTVNAGSTFTFTLPVAARVVEAIAR